MRGILMLFSFILMALPLSFAAAGPAAFLALETYQDIYTTAATKSLNEDRANAYKANASLLNMAIRGLQTESDLKVFELTKSKSYEVPQSAEHSDRILGFSR
jgi:hypothetical protein